MNKALSLLLHPHVLRRRLLAALSALVWWVGPLIALGDAPTAGDGLLAARR